MQARGMHRRPMITLLNTPVIAQTIPSTKPPPTHQIN